MSEAGPARRTLPGRLLAWLLVALLIVSLFAALQQLDVSRVVALLVDSRLRFVALAVFVNLTLNTYARVNRRAVLLRAAAGQGEALKFWELTWLYFASYAANNLLPARAGDLLFAVQMKRRGFRMASVLAAQLSEKVVELSSLWILIPPTLALTEMSPGMDIVLYLFLLTGALVFGMFVLFLRSDPADQPPRISLQAAPKGSVLRLWQRAKHGAWVALDSIRRTATPRVAVRALAWSCGQDASDILMVGLVALAVDIHVGPGGWLLVYLAVNLASALPSTPGQIGLIEAGA
ncbi:MAG: lysylphosphatidylglycerol synthase transmembrane domain-containing protein, partial [Vicinamibacteria bacterium]